MTSTYEGNSRLLQLRQAIRDLDASAQRATGKQPCAKTPECIKLDGHDSKCTVLK